MIIKQIPSSKIMTMRIRHDWNNHRVLFLAYNVGSFQAEFTVNTESIRELIRKSGDISDVTLGDIIMNHFTMHYSDSWDNAEIFIDRESVERRIALMSKRRDDQKTTVLQTILTMFRDKLQSRKEFFSVPV